VVFFIELCGKDNKSQQLEHERRSDNFGFADIKKTASKRKRFILMLSDFPR